MTRNQRRIRISWNLSVTRAIQLGNEDAAYKLTVAFVRRLKEIGVFTEDSYTTTEGVEAWRQK